MDEEATSTAAERQVQRTRVVIASILSSAVHLADPDFSPLLADHPTLSLLKKLLYPATAHYNDIIPLNRPIVNHSGLVATIW